MYDLADVTRWDPYDLGDLAHMFSGLDLYSIESYRSSITSHNGRYGMYGRLSR